MQRNFFSPRFSSSRFLLPTIAAHSPSSGARAVIVFRYYLIFSLWTGHTLSPAQQAGREPHSPNHSSSRPFSRHSSCGALLSRLCFRSSASHSHHQWKPPARLLISCCPYPARSSSLPRKRHGPTAAWAWAWDWDTSFLLLDSCQPAATLPLPH